MNKRLKILIPYDGSKNAEIALGVLRQSAEFAQHEIEALVVVSDVWLPDSPEKFARVSFERRRKAATSGISSHAPALRKWEEERVLAREAGKRIPLMFPLWNVRVDRLPGLSLASSEILEKAGREQTDVIVIGVEEVFEAEAAGCSGGALRVVKEAVCDVWLAREAGFGGERGFGFEVKENLPERAAFVLDTARANIEIAPAVARRKSSREVEEILRGTKCSVEFIRGIERKTKPAAA